MPLLSVVIPAHNEEHELPRTLAALRDALPGAGIPWEIIVAADACTDATPDIARAAGARLVRVEHRQIAATRNSGAAAARGDMLLFVDADTRVTPDAVRFAVAVMARGGVGGGARVRHEGLRGLRRAVEAVLVPLYFLSGCAAGCFVFARAEHFHALGGFDQTYYASEEVHLSLALRRRGRFAISPYPVYTSARKIRMYGLLGLLKETAKILLGGMDAVKRREGLGVWYDGRRETAGPQRAAATPGPREPSTRSA